MLRRRRAVAPPAPPGEVSIAAMRRRHVRAVVAIEERIFPRPWSAALYLSELAAPKGRAYYVALAGGAVVGYAGAMLVGDEAHVTTIGVAPEWQRRRVGTRLLARLLRDARRAGARSATLEVRMSNTGAQELYRRFGFAPAGIRKNYYAEVGEDALVMWAHDVDSDAYGERLEAIERALAAAQEEAQR
ncbi:MAG TPA: ribosomal protein S18-alanine N-acetyltransferase [Acidimicrobiales bacterium]|nr:ribosomal protein S18-alanine N-acetyltransferase [Acidimicrobiales bacterium]